MGARHREKGDGQEIGQDGLGDPITIVAEQRFNEIKLIGFVAYPDIAGHQRGRGDGAFELHAALREAHPKTFQRGRQLAFKGGNHPGETTGVTIAEACGTLVADAVGQREVIMGARKIAFCDLAQGPKVGTGSMTERCEGVLAAAIERDPLDALVTGLDVIKATRRNRQHDVATGGPVALARQRFQERQQWFDLAEASQKHQRVSDLDRQIRVPRNRVKRYLIRPALDSHEMRARHEVPGPGIHGFGRVLECARRDEVEHSLLRHARRAIPARGPHMDGKRDIRVAGIAQSGCEQTMIAEPAPVGVLGSQEQARPFQIAQDHA